MANSVSRDFEAFYERMLKQGAQPLQPTRGQSAHVSHVSGGWEAGLLSRCIGCSCCPPQDDPFYCRQCREGIRRTHG